MVGEAIKTAVQSQTKPGTQVDVNPKPNPKPTVVIGPLPTPSREREYYIEYYHLTIAKFAKDIKENGVKPVTGPSGFNDPKFYAWTLAPRYQPPTTPMQLAEMMDDFRDQLVTAYSPKADLDVVHVMLPEDVVADLESTGKLYYSAYNPSSELGYTQSVFQTTSFSTINRYRSLWYITDYSP
ncbi:MAG TPA: hypothetical protein VI793_10720 [Anaerolineales bacterium]|nr:hypothetical protein [Anaerolineales bacterium]